MTDERGATRSPIVWFVGGFVVCLAFFLGWGVWVNSAHAHPWAQFGDAFAPLTGFVTAVALLVSSGSVWLQREDIQIQQRDLSATVDAMREQASHAKSQVAAQVAATSEQAKAREVAVDANEIARHQLAMQVVAALIAKPFELGRGGTSEHAYAEAQEFLGECADYVIRTKRQADGTKDA